MANLPTVTGARRVAQSVLQCLRCAAFALCLAAGPASAQGVFGVTANVAGATASASYRSVEDAFNTLTDAGLSRLAGTYTGVEAASVSIDFRGVPINTAFPIAGGSTLTFVVPSLGINETFNGATRDESKRLLLDFLKKNQGGILDRLGRELARTSPVDPLAGNPNSLMSQMVAQDFNNAFGGLSSSLRDPSPGAGARGNLTGLGLRFGQYSQAGLSSRAVTLPLSYTFRSDIDPRRQLRINVPITVGDVEGSKSYSAGLGVSYAIPMNDYWSLQPAVNVSANGSVDLGSLASVASGSLTSSFIVPVGRFELGIANMVGYYTSLKVSTGNYSYDPGITNTVFRNGVLLSHRVPIFGATRGVEYSLVDTRFTGTALYIEDYQEVGIALNSAASLSSARGGWRVGLVYLHSSRSTGASITLNSWF